MTDRFDAVPVWVANEGRVVVRVVLREHLRLVDALAARLHSGSVERAHDGSAGGTLMGVDLPNGSTINLALPRVGSPETPVAN